jgi:hypothetical protein
MLRTNHEQVSFFNGTMADCTPNKGRKTLFVVGIQSLQTTLRHAFNHGCAHIYLGANQTLEETDEWYSFIQSIVYESIDVTLELGIDQWAWLGDTGLMEFYNFYPLINIKVPHIENASYNTFIRIDDVSFKSSNPGNWTHSMHDLQKRENFTPWKEYLNIEVIE